MNDDVKMLLEKVNRMTEELSRFKRALEAVINGEPFHEAFDEELFFEAKKDERAAISKAAVVMEHLLKLGYSTIRSYDTRRNDWRNHFDRHLTDLSGVLGWYTDRDENAIAKLESNLPKAYNGAKSLYLKAADEYDDLKPGIQKLPSDCPWTLEQLMEKGITQLVRMLPD